ncbi:MAG: glycoside hydrolase family 44 protein [Proteobacteria bacterium]|nr:glycoside hydrolase family 44 protein [Pseudomonadota bacterium]
MRRILGLVAVLCSGTAAAVVNVSVDLTANVHPFSPLIFGVAFGDPARNAQMGYTVDRWGGNSTTRYNWQTDVANHAFDYYFENIPNDAVSCAGSPANSADAFVYCARAAGAQALMTIPTIGWTPRSDSPSGHPYLAGFSVARYGVQIANPYGAPAVDPYDTDAGTGYCNPAVNKTGYCVGGLIVNNNPTDTSTAITPTFEQQWVAHMQSAFGTAANGGVKLFSLDNEVMLWDSTHRDVHPLPATYDEIWNKTVAYATAIKQQDPNALVTGPVTWGYCDLFGSAADNCLDGNDRQSHGGTPFVAWYLQQVCAYQQQNDVRLIDYLDLHWYPQDPNGAGGSIYSNDDDAATAGRRLRSLKELYDPDWVSEAWIGDLGDNDENHYDKPNLIPRARAWIDAYCPGTKLAITEYAWDQDQTGDGAVAQAEALAIFAREGVDLATRWIAPVANSPAERGFSIFLNYDGAGGRVQGDSVAATSANVDQIGAYAFHGNGKTFVLLTNKDTAANDVTVSFNASHFAAWKLYRFVGTGALGQNGSGTLNGATLALAALPARSANLLVVPDDDVIFKNGFE